jgi:hypothetical protein
VYGAEIHPGPQEGILNLHNQPAPLREDIITDRWQLFRLSSRSARTNSPVFGLQVFVRGLLFLLLVLTSILVYLPSGATPIIPKRFFVPIVLFTPVVEVGLSDSQGLLNFF